VALLNCRHCETQNPDTARFCSTCGEPLVSSGDAGSHSPSLTGTRTQFHPAPMPADEAGRPFGARYLLLKRLGKGGMGEVWKARDLELEQIVALKMIRPELLEDADLVERFKKEITLARKVTHRNVTRIYDLGEVEGTRFISMEYLEGMNLKDFVQQEGALPEEKAISIIGGICEGLKAAHDAGVVHRDLKPQNILIDQHGQAHIMDFGIAFSGETAGITRTGALIGTPEYMSPEQVRGERLDARSDIYSLGLILYEMVTKDLPFPSDSVAASMYKRLSEKPRRPREVKRDLPPFLEKIILRCLEKERAFRYADIGELLEDLRQKQAPGLRRGRLAALAGRKAVLMSGVILLIAAGAAVALLVQRRVSPAPRPAPAPAGAPAISLAVFPFQNMTGDPNIAWIRSGLANLLTTDLTQARGIRVVSAARLSQTLNHLRLADLPAYDADTLQRVAGFVNVQMYLTGSFASLGGKIRVDAQIFRMEGKSAMPVAPFKAEARSEQDLFALVDSLARQVREKLGLSPAQIRAERSREIRRVTTASVPALREYTLALDLLHRGNYLEAVPGFQKAVGLDPSFAMAHTRLGEAFKALGRDPEALASLDTAAAHLDRVTERERFEINALRADLKHDDEAAIRSYETLVREFPNDPESYFNLASIYEQSGQDYDKAIENYRNALAGDASYAPAHYGLGRAYFRKGNFEEALKSFDAALRIQDQLGNLEGKATALNGLGAVYYEMGRDEEAVRHYRQSAEIKKQLGDLAGYAKSLSNIAQSDRRSGKYGEAILTVREALEIRKKIGDRKGECSTLESLGSIYYDAGRYEESLKAHQDSLRIAREVGDPRLVADNLANIGTVYLAQGRYTDADVFYQQALESRRRLGIQDGILKSLVDLGNLESAEGSPEKAMQHYLEAMQIARESEDADSVNAITINLGELYAEQGHYKSAQKSFEDALNDLRSSGDQLYFSLALKDSGNLLGLLGRFSEALARLSEAEKVARKTRNDALLGEILTARGDLLLRQGGLADAEKAFREAVNLSSRRKDLVAALRARIGTARVASLGGSAAGLRELSKAAEEAESLGNVPLILCARVAASRALLRAGRREQAFLEAGKAISRKAGYEGGEQLFQAHFLRGMSGIGGPDGETSAKHLIQALQILDSIRAELADAPTIGTFLARPDLKSDLLELSRGLKQSGKPAEANRASSMLR
jgi:eukaryotic-like serine/threonine-protein kinase